MKAYKRFNKDMTCRGLQYEEGKTYETDNAVLCNAGFHACENPLDCGSYYSPAESVIREVELEDVSPDRQEDSKVVAKKITIGAQLDVMWLCKAHFEYVTSKCTVKKGGENQNNVAVSAGENGSAAAGYKGSAAAGESGIACVRGGKVKGGIGCLLAIAETDDAGNATGKFAAGIVDGKILKPDTWYICRNGEFVEDGNE